jgi:hypothetical protein
MPVMVKANVILIVKVQFSNIKPILNLDCRKVDPVQPAPNIIMFLYICESVHSMYHLEHLSYIVK